MTPRTRPLIALVASVVVLAGSIGAWAVLRGNAVGRDLEQVTTGARTPAPPPVAEPSATPTPSASPTSPAWVTDETTRVDATIIPTPEPVVPPLQVSIPSVGVTMPIAATGVQDDGQMELPDDPAVIGWYRYGAQPGDSQGSAVLGGHVDSVEYGVGPLARLATVEPGAEVTVTAGDGTVLRYQVVSVERIVQEALPTDRLFAEDVPHQLAVVTCGGRYLPDAGGYEDNIVVTAIPVT